MDILVTGLCLQGNKGGPALALSLMKVLKRELGSVRFTFSVPEKDIAEEREWAARYGVEAIPSCMWPLPHVLLNKKRRQNLIGWVKRLRQVDAVVDLSAISYVGPPIREARRLPLALYEPRFRWCVLANAFRKPFLAWTQSYGPFSTWDLRWAGTYDLRRQDYVFCRGEETARAVQCLLKHARIRSYPDVAVVLDYDVRRGAAHVAARLPHVAEGRLVTLSPSAVLFSRARPHPDWHLRALVEMVERLVAMGYFVLLAPHTYRKGSNDPAHCDYALARAIVREANVPVGRLAVIDANLPPDELKSIIACASVHIGGRYHSVVAALSSGVPCISLSWHHKYKDIMSMYGAEEYVLDCSGGVDLDRFIAIFDRLVAHRDEIRQLVCRKHDHVQSLVHENVRLFVTCLS